MTQSRIIRLALPTPLRRLFDYLPPQDVDIKSLIPGVRVSVPFQKRCLVGILVAVVEKSEVSYAKLKPANAVLDKEPLFANDIYQLCLWAADYYHCSLGEVLAGALPSLLRKGKNLDEQEGVSHERVLLGAPDEVLQLNAGQQAALSAICAAKNQFQTFLLDGVTGSGKTEVYLRAIAEIIKENKQVLVLVPEISLTPQTIERFRKRFPLVIVALHSHLSAQARMHAWLAAKNGDAQIVIGTRSAIFTPFTNLGLIIVDEEHDVSFKQQDRFRYHARDLAIMRASINHVPVVLGSATPSLESLFNVQRHRYIDLALPERAGNANLPQYQLIDLRQQKLIAGLSSSLLQTMQEHLAEDNQVMLFLNRRGFAPILYCTQCANIIGCSRCDSRMVYHASPKRLQCHHCDACKAVPTVCEKCGNETLEPIGFGTQRIEHILQNHFPDVPIIRVDRDNTRRKNAMQNLLNQIHEEKKAILLGTQMLAKGHHFPNVTLVAVIDADSGLFSADFRAVEQMGQLLMQVAGRAGRAEKPGTVLIQTRNPDHPLLQMLIHQGYQAFARHLLAEREMAVLPPFSYFALFRAESYQVEQANQFLTAIKKIGQSISKVVNLSGPVPAVMAKRKGLHCQYLLIQAQKRGILQQFLQKMIAQIETLPANRLVKWIIDVDPMELI